MHMVAGHALGIARVVGVEMWMGVRVRVGMEVRMLMIMSMLDHADDIHLAVVNAAFSANGVGQGHDGDGHAS